MQRALRDRAVAALGGVEYIAHKSGMCDSGGLGPSPCRAP
jgi:hypothetical protein